MRFYPNVAARLEKIPEAMKDLQGSLHKEEVVDALTTILLITKRTWACHEFQQSAAQVYWLGSEGSVLRLCEENAAIEPRETCPKARLGASATLI